MVYKKTIKKIEKKASLIILNWSGKEDTKQCLLSLKNLKYSNFEVVLVDNGSKDNSIKELDRFILKNKFFYPIKFIKNEKNLGFTGGNIEGLKQASGEYIVLLNNDVVVDPEWLTELISPLSKDSKIGVVGGKTFQWNEKNPAFCRKNASFAFQRIDPYLGYAHTLTNIDTSAEADSISGCAVLIRKEVISKVGFLEPEFFAYYEETDLFARIIRAGYKVYYSPKALIWHKIAASSGTFSYFYLYQMARNRAVFAFRNFDDPYFGFFRKNYFKNGWRALASYYLKGRYDNETKAKKDSFLYILKHRTRLLAERKEIVFQGSYNEKLNFANEQTVSIIIPNYNYEKYIEEAIKSALDQSIKPLEIIVVDDGSKDKSVQKIKKYSVKLIQQKNQGVVAAKNRGFSEARGRFVLFLDADDKLASNAVEEYLKRYQEDKSVGFVYSDMQYFGAAKGIYQAQPFNPKNLRKGNYIHNSALIKREAFEAVGGYHPSMKDGYEDWDLYLALVEQGYKGAYVPCRLLLYRRHEDALSRNEIDQKKALSIIYHVYRRHPRIFPRWYVFAKRIHNQAYYGDGKANYLLRIIFFIFRIIHKFFTLLKLIVTFRWTEAAKKVFGELHFWKALIQRKNR